MRVGAARSRTQNRALVFMATIIGRWVHRSREGALMWPAGALVSPIPLLTIELPENPGVFGNFAGNRVAATARRQRSPERG
jgi:hypothetical protein